MLTSNPDHLQRQRYSVILGERHSGAAKNLGCLRRWEILRRDQDDVYR